MGAELGSFSNPEFPSKRTLKRALRFTSHPSTVTRSPGISGRTSKDVQSLWMMVRKWSLPIVHPDKKDLELIASLTHFGILMHFELHCHYMS